MESPTTKVRNHTKTYGSGKGEVWFYYLCNSTWVTPNVLPFLRQFSHRDNVKKNAILTHQKPTLLFYHIIL